MKKEIVKPSQKAESRSPMGKLILVATVASGVVAAYMMYKRGASLPSIAMRTITNPVGSLVTEVKDAV